MTKTTVVITIDGLDPEYLDACDAPNLQELGRKGFLKIGKSMMPSVTNVNNVSLVTASCSSTVGESVPSSGASTDSVASSAASPRAGG